MLPCDTRILRALRSWPSSINFKQCALLEPGSREVELTARARVVAMSSLRSRTRSAYFRGRNTRSTSEHQHDQRLHHGVHSAVTAAEGPRAIAARGPSLDWGRTVIVALTVLPPAKNDAGGEHPGLAEFVCDFAYGI